MARKHGLKWMGDATVNGKRKRIVFATKEEAEAYEANPFSVVQEIKEVATVGKMFPIWARTCYGGTRNEKRAMAIADELMTLLGEDTLVTEVDRKAVNTLIAELEAKGNKKTTINTKTSTLSRILKHARDEEVIETVPAIPFFSSKQGRIRFLTKDEETAIFSRLAEPYRQYASFLVATGCRPSEASALKWTDVTEDTVTFWDTKNDLTRTIPLTEKAKEAIKWFRECKGIPKARDEHRRLGKYTPKVFGLIKYDTFYHEFIRAKTAVGLGADKQVIPYILRHTCATRLGKSGMSELRVMQWMGHKSLEMTRRYTHYGVDDLKMGLEAVS